MATLARKSIHYAVAACGVQIAIATLVVRLPAWLEQLGASPWWIGLFLAIEPAGALLVGPLLGPASDRRRARGGTRRPFLVAGLIFCAAGLAGVGRATGLGGIAFALVALALGMAAFFPAYRAMLADEFPAAQRGMTNGIVALCRELGNLGTLVLVAICLRGAAPFYFAAAMVALTFGWTLLRLSPARDAASREAAPAAPWRWRPLRWVVAAQACWWFALEAGKACVVLYVVHDIQHVRAIGSAPGQAAVGLAALVLAAVSACGLAASVPLGMLARRVGAHRVLAGALALLLASYVACALATSTAQLFAVAPFFGVGYAGLQVLSFPYLLERKRGGDGAAGSLHGVLTYGAQMLACPFMGALAQATGTFKDVFWIGAALFAVALALHARAGEAQAAFEEARAA